MSPVPSSPGGERGLHPSALGREDTVFEARSPSAWSPGQGGVKVIGVGRQGGPLEGGAPPHTGLIPSELAELCMLFPKWNLLISVDGYTFPVGYLF